MSLEAVLHELVQLAALAGVAYIGRRDVLRAFGDLRRIADALQGAEVVTIRPARPTAADDGDRIAG